MICEVVFWDFISCLTLLDETYTTSLGLGLTALSTRCGLCGIFGYFLLFLCLLKFPPLSSYATIQWRRFRFRDPAFVWRDFSPNDTTMARCMYVGKNCRTRQTQCRHLGSGKASLGELQDRIILESSGLEQHGTYYVAAIATLTREIRV